MNELKKMEGVRSATHGKFAIRPASIRSRPFRSLLILAAGCALVAAAVGVALQRRERPTPAVESVVNSPSAPLQTPADLPPIAATVAAPVPPHSDEAEVTPRPFRPAADCSLQPAASLAIHPVSIIRLDGDRYLLCNYNEVQEVNLRTGAVRPVAPPPEVKLWVPTGLCRGSEGTVFVANYTGHDVLELRPRGDRFELVRRLVHPEMVSPENVHLSPDGALLAVADYDGDRLLVFRRNGELAWSRPVGNAHGVTFSPDGIAVTGLKERTVTVFDLAGKQLYQTGCLGWGEREYLWPTCITWAGGRYYVSDAHTGRITVLDRTLQLVDWVGGNGPGAGLFNMPYGLCVVGEDFLVCDTFKHRLVLLDGQWRCRRVVARGGEPLCWGTTPPAAERRERGYVDPTRRLQKTLPVFGSRTWMPAYGGFEWEDAGRHQFARYPVITSLWNGHAFSYFCWCLPVGCEGQEYLLLGHSADTEVLIVDGRGRCWNANAKEYLWCVNGRLLTNAGAAFDPAPVVQVAASRFAKHDRLLKEEVDPVTAAQRAFWPKLAGDAVRRRLQEEFLTPAGKAFWEQHSQAKTAEERVAAGRAFDAALRKDYEVRLQEVFTRYLLVPAE